MKEQNQNSDCVENNMQTTQLDLYGEESGPEISARRINGHRFPPQECLSGRFRLHNRRYLGNKRKLLGFIEDVVSEKCGPIKSFCDIFAGTGVVGERFNNQAIKMGIIYNSYIFCLTFA